jgi:hypothetical protein
MLRLRSVQATLTTHNAQLTIHVSRLTIPFSFFTFHSSLFTYLDSSVYISHDHCLRFSFPAKEDQPEN